MFEFVRKMSWVLCLAGAGVLAVGCQHEQTSAIRQLAVSPVLAPVDAPPSSPERPRRQGAGYDDDLVGLDTQEAPDLLMAKVRRLLLNGEADFDETKPLPYDALEELSRRSIRHAERRPVDEAELVERRDKQRQYEDYIHARPGLSAKDAAAAKIAIIVGEEQ